MSYKLNMTVAWRQGLTRVRVGCRPAADDDPELSRPSYLLDIGAGSGLSGEILTEEGHDWVGMDVSGGMLGKQPGGDEALRAFARGGVQTVKSRR